MACQLFKPFFLPHSEGGLKIVSSQNDSTICIEWEKAYPGDSNNKIAYNIYYSSTITDVYSEGVKFVSIDDGYFNACLTGFKPADVYFFAVKATEYSTSWFVLSSIPVVGDLRTYPEDVLLNNITDTSTSIKVSDINQFPSFGVIQIGYELIKYSNRDIPSSSLIASERGFLDSTATLHQTDGYDGTAFRDPVIRFFKGFEDDNEIVLQVTSKFIYPNYAFTTNDGYATEVDLLTTDLSASDSTTEDFPIYDYAGWHRTDPKQLLNGDCVGSYYGGYEFCADGYSHVGQQIRGVSFQDQASRREEMLLRLEGEPCILLKRLWSGIRCKCIYNTSEHPEYKCPKCFGVGFVGAYNRFYNPRNSDGRIMVRFDPSVDDLKMENAGLESDFAPTCWTLVYPAVKDKDMLIRFNQDGTEEFRYEILNVTRNKLLLSLSGAQKFAVKRVRKSDPVYMYKTIKNTSTMPTSINTSIGFVKGPGGILIPHSHTIVGSEMIGSLSQINSTTSYDFLHNHSVSSGVVSEEIGHTHSIIF